VLRLRPPVLEVSRIGIQLRLADRLCLVLGLVALVHGGGQIRRSLESVLLSNLGVRVSSTNTCPAWPRHRTGIAMSARAPSLPSRYPRPHGPQAPHRAHFGLPVGEPALATVTVCGGAAFLSLSLQRSWLSRCLNPTIAASSAPPRSPR